MTTLARRLLLPALALLVVTAGCGARGTGDKGYVDGDGLVTQVAMKDRLPVGTISGDTLEGTHVDVADYRGKVVVLNVWASWCGPCRAEAATLVAASKRLAPKGVVFVGINTRDASRANARAFDRRYGIGYPTIYDPSGNTLLAFHGTVGPNAVPSTIVLDPRGRIAASVQGELNGRSTLADLVHDARAVGS